MNGGRHTSPSKRDLTPDCLLLSLPGELLSLVLTLLTHSHDRCSVALSCSRLRRLSRRTPHSLHLEFVSPFQSSKWNGWFKDLHDFSRVFTHISDLTVEVRSSPGNELLSSIGAACPKLERLRVVATWAGFFSNTAGWTSLAAQCPRWRKREARGKQEGKQSGSNTGDQMSIPHWEDENQDVA